MKIFVVVAFLCGACHKVDTVENESLRAEQIVLPLNRDRMVKRATGF